MFGFKQDETTHKFVFDSCTCEGLQDITSELTQEQIQSNLNELVPFVYHLDIPSDQVLTNVKTWMSKAFATYSDKGRVDEVWLRDTIKKAGGFDPDENGMLTFKWNSGSGKLF